MAQEPAFSFDDDTQREILHDEDQARAWIVHLESLGLLGDPMRVVWLRIMGDLHEAQNVGWQVLHRAGGPAGPDLDSGLPLPLTAVTAAVRLAHVLQWQGDFDTALTLHQAAIATVEGVEPMSEDSAYADYLLPFTYQHLARCYYDQGDYEAALYHAQQALELRQFAGVPADQQLISEGLISAARARLGGLSLA